MGFVFGRDKMDRMPALKAIGTPTTGVPHIDVEYAAERGISVCSLRDQQEFLGTITPTAELAWGLVIAVTRRIPWAHAAACEGQWGGRPFGMKTPRMLSRMRLGVIGLGRLGSLVAGYGTAFGMDVSYFDPHINDDRYFRCGDLHELASKSDVVSLHVHFAPDTDHFIKGEFFEAMPEGSFFINTARGNLVDEDALLKALESGHLGGVGLDTLDGEHLQGFMDGLEGHPLISYAREHDNLVFTPHMGGSTRDSWELTEARVINMMIEALKTEGAG
jgi:D-3-phosphoglycerate dehydrogenase